MRLRHNISYSDTRAELKEYKDLRHGATDDAFWPEDELVDYRPKSKKKKHVRHGCDANNNKQHIWVWTTEFNKRTLFSDYFGFHKYEKLYCAGCEKRGNRIRRPRDTTRYTEQYVKMFGNPNTWDSPELKIEEFYAKREAFYKVHGWSDYIYNSRW